MTGKSTINRIWNDHSLFVGGEVGAEADADPVMEEVVATPGVLGVYTLKYISSEKYRKNTR